VIYRGYPDTITHAADACVIVADVCVIVADACAIVADAYICQWDELYSG